MINNVKSIKSVTNKPKNGIYDAEGTFPSIHAIPKLVHKFIVSITDDFDDARYYDDVVALLASSTDEDEIVWNISSRGGYVDTLQMLLGWKAMNPSKHTHVLCSNASSAASAFFLSEADEYIVSEGATMMIHEQQVGNYGSNSNVTRKAEHNAKQNEKFVRETYKDFLTDSEIDDVLRGVEYYLDADEIRERLQQREEIKAQQQSQEENDFLESLTSENIDDIVKELTDEELAEELELANEGLKAVKKEQARRKKGHK